MKESYIEKLKELNLKDEMYNKYINQMNIFFKMQENTPVTHSYKLGEEVKLKKGTMLHGTYKNLEALKSIVKSGLLASHFINGRRAKYPSCVDVWILKQDYTLKEYINFYNGGTIEYMNMISDELERETEVIPYNEMPSLMERIKNKGYHRWMIEQTKEARFLPSFSQDIVQIGIIFNNNDEINQIRDNDILIPGYLNEEEITQIVHPGIKDKFIKGINNKDDFFTDREGALLFGIPSTQIEGILVGRIYEKDKEILKEIKTILPNAYICNLDGNVICE